MTTIYLCGPINGRDDNSAKGWREIVKRLWRGKFIDPMERDYRGVEADNAVAAEIVAGDLAGIDASDYVIAYYDKPSVGTSMEIFYAKHCAKKPVIVIDASNAPLSPWLIHHSDSVVYHIATALAVVDMHRNAARDG